MPYFITRDGIPYAMNIDELIMDVQEDFLVRPRNNLVFVDFVMMKKIANLGNEGSVRLSRDFRTRLNTCLYDHGLVDFKEDLTEKGQRFVAALDEEIRIKFGDEATWEDVLVLKKILDGSSIDIGEGEKKSLEYWLNRDVVQSFGNSEYRNYFIDNLEEFDFEKSYLLGGTTIGLYSGAPENISQLSSLLDLYQKIALRKPYNKEALIIAINTLGKRFLSKARYLPKVHEEWLLKLSSYMIDKNEEDLEKLFIEAFRGEPYSIEKHIEESLDESKRRLSSLDTDSSRDLFGALAMLGGEKDERIFGLPAAHIRSGLSSFFDFFQENSITGEIKDNIFDLVDDPDVGLRGKEFSVSIEEDFDDFIKEQKKRKEGDSDPEFKGFL